MFGNNQQIMTVLINTKVEPYRSERLTLMAGQAAALSDDAYAEALAAKFPGRFAVLDSSVSEFLLDSDLGIRADEPFNADVLEGFQGKIELVEPAPAADAESLPDADDAIGAPVGEPVPEPAAAAPEATPPVVVQVVDDAKNPVDDVDAGVEVARPKSARPKSAPKGDTGSGKRAPR